MLRNPIHKRLSQLNHWQLMTFMAALCLRMYPNYRFFCKETGFGDSIIYSNILDLVWENLTVKDAKINFDHQLEKFETEIPVLDEYDVYAVYPAVDACKALSELLHAQLSGELLEHAIVISKISLSTVAFLEIGRINKELNDNTLKSLPAIIDELDVQWEIYRLLKEQQELNIELIKGIKDDIKESNSSNIGLMLS